MSALPPPSIIRRCQTRAVPEDDVPALPSGPGSHHPSPRRRRSLILRLGLFATVILATLAVALYALRPWADRADQEATLSGRVVTAADVAGLRLDGAAMVRSNLDGLDLTGAHLRQALLIGASLRGVILARAQLQGADLADADLRGADLAGADLTGANLAGACLKGASLTLARLGGVVIRGATYDKDQFLAAATQPIPETSTSPPQSSTPC
jgi:uncharacterized protein YjbI with pentapeptide repeats